MIKKAGKTRVFCGERLRVETEQGEKDITCLLEKGHSGQHIRIGEDTPLFMDGRRNPLGGKMVWKFEWPYGSVFETSSQRCLCRIKPEASGEFPLTFQCQLSHTGGLHWKTGLDPISKKAWLLTWEPK
jgi:hypothetical protein